MLTVNGFRTREGINGTEILSKEPDDLLLLRMNVQAANIKHLTEKFVWSDWAKSQHELTPGRMARQAEFEVSSMEADRPESRRLLVTLSRQTRTVSVGGGWAGRVVHNRWIWSATAWDRYITEQRAARIGSTEFIFGSCNAGNKLRSADAIEAFISLLNERLGDWAEVFVSEFGVPRDIRLPSVLFGEVSVFRHWPCPGSNGRSCFVHGKVKHLLKSVVWHGMVGPSKCAQGMLAA